MTATASMLSLISLYSGPVALCNVKGKNTIGSEDGRKRNREDQNDKKDGTTTTGREEGKRLRVDAQMDKKKKKFTDRKLNGHDEGSLRDNDDNHCSDQNHYSSEHDSSENNTIATPNSTVVDATVDSPVTPSLSCGEHVSSTIPDDQSLHINETHRLCPTR